MSQWQNGAAAAPRDTDAQEANRAQYMNKLKRENPHQYLIEVQKRKDEDRARELRQLKEDKLEKEQNGLGYRLPQKVPPAQPAAVPARRYDPYAPSADNPLVEHSDSSDFGDAADPAFAQANADSRPDQLKRLLQDSSSKDSLCCRMETLRAYIEKELGFDKFIAVYQQVQGAREADCELDGAKLRALLGEENMGWLNLIVQLILVEQNFN